MTTSLFHRILGSRSLGAVVLAASVMVTSVASADSYAPPSGDAQATALFKLGSKEKKSHYEIKDLKYKVGRAEIFVNAPMAQVKAAVLDYNSYSTVIPRFQKAKILKQNGQAAEVFVQVPILHGAATIWAVENFGTPAADGKNGEKIVGTMQKGNVTDLRATWRYRAVDDTHTVVSLDLYIDPKLNADDGLVTNEVEDACGDGVRGIKERAEALAKKVASNP